MRSYPRLAVPTLALTLALVAPGYCLTDVEIGEAVRVKSSQWMLLRKQAIEFGEAGKVDEAVAKLEEIVADRKELGRDTSSERAEMARIYSKVPAHYEDARKIYAELLAEREKQYGQDDPMIIWSLNEYAGFLTARGEKEKADSLKARVAEIEKKEKLPPVKEVDEILSGSADSKKKLESLIELGTKYVGRDRDIQALYCFDQAIKLDSKCGKAYSERSDVNRRMGKDGKAKADIKKAIILDSRFGKSYFRQAMLLESDEKLDLAVIAFAKAIECDANDIESLGSRGKLLSNLGRKEEALKDFSRVIEIKPELNWPYVQRGIVYGDLGQTKKAIEDFSLLIKRSPKKFDYYELRAGAYEKDGDYKLALADFEEVILLNPGYAGGTVGKERVLKQVESTR